MATNQEMPEDVLMLILSRLPVKSLLRFRSVSKYWNSLIQNPSFISLHNNRSRKNDSLLVKRYRKKDSLHILSLVSTETPSNDLFLPFVGTRARDLKLFGSSNGVVCLGDISSANFMLCNPAMREFRILPLPPYRTRHVTSNLGFGLDLENNDYKVLRVAPLYKHDPRIPAEIRVEERVQIYSMSADSWREIVAMVPKDVLLYPEHSFATLLNGVFYWMCVDRKILAFHLSGEVFEQAFLPEDIGIHLFSDLCVLRDSLALAITSKLDSLTTEWSLGIWVRDGNRVKDPWNKKYSIGPIAPCRITLRFRLINGELLLFRGNDDCRIVSYNLDTHSIKEYPEVYDYPRSIDFQVLPYTENLVSIKKRVYCSHDLRRATCS